MISLSQLAKQVRRVSQHSKLLRTFATTSNQALIEEALDRHLSLELLKINDESSKHMEAQDSHFNIYVVSNDFDGKSLIQR